jgi:hypothetical protein
MIFSGVPVGDATAELAPDAALDAELELPPLLPLELHPATRIRLTDAAVIE